MPKLLKIIEYPHKTLNTPTKEVKELTPKLLELAEDMTHTMLESGGVGLAANQVGEDVNLIVMKVEEPYVMFNPKMTRVSTNKHKGKEGCLSLPDLLIELERRKWVKVTFMDENWEKRVLKFRGLEARCLAHEIDHLQGKTMLDVMEPMALITKRKNNT